MFRQAAADALTRRSNASRLFAPEISSDELLKLPPISTSRKNLPPGVAGPDSASAFPRESCPSEPVRPRNSGLFRLEV
jgi:hypothetical protein